MFKTEQDFILPLGYLDGSGKLHREGTLRLITAKDEIEAAQDAKVKRNPAYLPVFLLARTLSRLGQVKTVDDEVVENFFQPDYLFLQELYTRLNQTNDLSQEFACPHCQTPNRTELPVLFKDFRMETEAPKTVSAQISEERPSHVRA